MNDVETRRQIGAMKGAIDALKSVIRFHHDALSVDLRSDIYRQIRRCDEAIKVCQCSFHQRRQQ
jgi:hypothetical protein